MTSCSRLVQTQLIFTCFLTELEIHIADAAQWQSHDTAIPACWLLDAEARIRCQACLCSICGGHSCNMTVFFPNVLFVSCQHYSTWVPNRRCIIIVIYNYVQQHCKHNSQHSKTECTILFILFYFLFCILFFHFLFCIITNKCTSISQIMTILPVSTLSYHP